MIDYSIQPIIKTDLRKIIRDIVMKEIIKILFKSDQLIRLLSFGYIGLLFAGRAGLDVWVLVTIAFISGKIAHLCFTTVRKDAGKSTGIRDRVNPESRKENYKLWIYAILSSAVFIFSSFMINQLCYYFSIGSIVVMIGIIMLKKYGSLPSFNLRFFDVLCPIGGFVAADNRFEIIAFILACAVLFRNAGLGIASVLYEPLNDKEKKSYFIKRYGISKSYVLTIVFFIISALLLIAAGIISGRGMAYWISVLCFAIIIIRQISLLKNKDSEESKNEFMQINNFAAPLLLVGTIIDIFFFI
jgi:4-hydroxybenzoate polyprenyltransferase